MEKRVLFTELDDRGSHLRKEITPTAVVTDKRRFPVGLFWDANKTYDVIVADATSASDTLEKAEKNLNNEITRATNAENALSDRIDDLLGIDALNIEDLKQIVEDLDPETGILSVIDQKADKEDLDLLRDDISVDTTKGHDYVEIGGIKWATMNVGAQSVTDAGLYFQWGDPQGYTASQCGSGEGQKYFGWADYKWTEDGGLTFTKYNSSDGKAVLDASDDAVQANWGGQWRMPTTEEYLALGNAVNTAWTDDYQGSGVAGLVCTDKTDSSKILFFPASGYCSNGGVYSVGSFGLYPSSSLKDSDVQSTYISNLNDGNVNWQSSGWRRFGFSVRGVYTGDKPSGTGDKVLGTTILDSERTAWNAKSNFSGSYDDLTNKPTIPSIWVGTLQEYDLIDPIDPSTIYIIK